MKKSNRSFLIVLAVVIVIVAIGIFASRRSPAPAVPSSAPAATGTAASSGAATGTASSSEKPGATITFDRFYQGSSFTFSYPPSWSVLAAAPFAMTNFNGQYGPNNTIPAGGAEIDVVTTTVYGNLQGIMDTELMGAQNLVTSLVTVGGVSCREARYDTSHSGSPTTATVALYCPRNTELWKIYLAYRANDPSSTALLSDFHEVLTTIKFIP